MRLQMKSPPRSGSNQFDEMGFTLRQFTGGDDDEEARLTEEDATPIHLPGQLSPRSDHTDDDVEYFHEIDVCAEEDFWWDEEDRHEL